MHVNTGSHRCSPFLIRLCHPQRSPHAGGGCEKADKAGFLDTEEGESEPGKAYPGMAERLFIRILMGAMLCMALLAFVLVPMPEDAKGEAVLPAIAFEQVGLYRMEVALLVFYGSLLLVTPAFSGLAHGRLPIEISTKGARFADEAGNSAEGNEAALRKLERSFDDLADGLTEAKVEIDRLKRSRGDST